MTSQHGPRPLVLCALGALLLAVAAAGTAAQPAPKKTPTRTAPAASRPPSSAADPVASLEASIGIAEASLRTGEFQIAESRYRDALLQGWMLAGALEIANGNMAEARDSFSHASTVAVAADQALQSLGLVQLQMGQGEAAVTTLSGLVSRQPRNVELRTLLAMALDSAVHPGQAVQELDEARRALPPSDVEARFRIASAYLRLKQPKVAAELLDEVLRARPIAATYVLVGRTYRDFGEYAKARDALDTALKTDPRVRRAHYYLGTIAIMQEGDVRLDEAITEFRQELEIAPNDALTHLRLGLILVEAKRYDEAIPSLQLAIRDNPSAPPSAFHALGRSQIAIGRPAEAVESLRRALTLAEQVNVDDGKLGSMHYLLATALRSLGRTDEAQPHFDQAQRLSAKRNEATRSQLSRYLGETQDAPAPADAGTLGTPFATEPPERRAALLRRTKTAIARAYFNIGIMHAQAQRIPRAADYLAEAAAADPDLPEVQYSLGVACFNAQRYKQAIAPLARAVETGSHAQEARRMLALSYLNVEDYGNAARLLVDDPGRDRDPSLQYAYGIALVRSNHPREAEAVFTSLIGTNENNPELNVLMGQAYAQQGDMENALKFLQRAVELKPDIAEANTSLGIIYLKSGKLDEAAAALQSQLKATPADTTAQHTLATVLELQGKPDEAIPLLRSALSAKPDFADARYLLGKILLAQGKAAEAAEHLEAAARLAPEDFNIHYQLASAYRKLGRTELAAKELEIYQQIKDKMRGKTQ